MYPIGKITALTLLSAACTGLTGCCTDPLCYPCGPAPENDAHIRVTFDWSADTAANPDGMRLWFYPADGNGAPRLRDIAGRDGGLISLPAGAYDILAYNNDTEWLLFDGVDSLQSHRCKTPVQSIDDAFRSPRSARSTSPDEPVAAYPEAFWTDVQHSKSITDSAEIILAPQPLHCQYAITVKHVEGLERLSEAAFTMSGMSRGVDLSTGNNLAESCTHSIAAHINRSDSTLTAAFTCFGPAGNAPVKLTAYLILDDGRRYKIAFPESAGVERQVISAPDPRNVAITVDKLSVPSSESGEGGGYGVSGDDWTDIDIEVGV